MPGNPHPFTAPYADRDASALLGAEQLYVQIELADSDEVTNTDLSQQFASIKLRSTGKSYHRDPEDIQEPDGVNVLQSADGMHWIEDAVVAVETEKEVTAAGDVTLADDEAADFIYINNTSGGAISVFLPSAAIRTKRITVKDGAGNAGTYAITLKPKAATSETIFGVTDGSLSIIDSNYSGFELKPRTSTGAGYQ